MPMTAERAKQIRLAWQKIAGWPPDVPPVTPEEDAEIRAKWNTLSPFSTLYGALHVIEDAAKGGPA